MNWQSIHDSHEYSPLNRFNRGKSFQTVQAGPCEFLTLDQENFYPWLFGIL